MIFKINFKPPSPAKAGEINYNFFDVYTIAHFLIGVLYGLLDFSFLFSSALGIAWELVENTLKANLPNLFPNSTADTLKNSIGDVIAVMAGWWIVSYLITFFK